MKTNKYDDDNLSIKSNRLFRYTSLPLALDMIRNASLQLSDPTYWEDTNDSHYIHRYIHLSRLAGLHAICFTQTSDRFHFWKVYANGSWGVRLEFDKKRLLESIPDNQGLRHGEVNYLKINELRKQHVDVANLPFIKRWPYKDENEFRLFVEHHKGEEAVNRIGIDLSSLKRITLSPFATDEQRKLMREQLRLSLGQFDVRISNSTILNNGPWKNGQIP